MDPKSGSHNLKIPSKYQALPPTPSLSIVKPPRCWTNISNVVNGLKFTKF